MNQSNQDRELENRIVEFEEWCQANDSNDIDAFCTEKQLGPKIAEGLKQLFQMEDDIAKLVEAAPEVTAMKAKDLSNTTIGNYQLERKLGAGGMGTVWLANQSHPVKRKVAIKLIRPDHRSSEVTARRFEREKQALALMSHTHVAKVFDAGTSENDLPYIAMEFIDGQSITEYCTSRQLPLSDRLELFLQLCSAIQHAHQNGLLHRDIKPGNILVTEVDGKPCVKVIDFGLVRPSANWDPEITQADMVVGSPLWMSPEQARGYRSDASADEAKATVDTRADVYSLGVILYQLLTESGPITYEYYEKATKLEMLKTIQDETPELPSTRVGKHRFAAGKDSTPVSSWANVLRNELDWVTMRALEKDRDRRYPTVAAFADDVRNYLQNEPVTARPPSFSYRLKKLAQRHKTATIAAATIFGLLAFSSVGFAWLYSVASNQTAIAKMAETDARQARERTDVTLSLMAEVMEAFNPSRNGARLTQSQLKQLDRYRSSLNALDLSHDLPLEAKLRGLLAKSYAGSAESDSAIEQYERVIAITKETPDVDPRTRISAQLALVVEFNRHNTGEKAIPQLKECLKESLERFGEKDELSIRSKVILSRNTFTTSNVGFSEYTKELEEDLVLAKKALGDTHSTTLLTMTTLARAYVAQNRFPKAKVLYESAVQLANELFGPDALTTIRIKIDSLALEGPNFVEKLETLLQKATTKFGTDNSFVWTLKYEGGSMAFARGAPDLAIAIFTKLIEDCEGNVESTHPMVLQSKIQLGRAYHAKAMGGIRALNKSMPTSDVLLDKAVEVLKSATNTFDEMNQPEDNSAMMAWATLARVKLAQGDPSEALELAKHYGPIAKERYGYDNPPTQALYEVQRACLVKLNRGKEAVENSIKEYEETLRMVPKPVFVSSRLANFIANSSADMGERGQALKYFNIAFELEIAMQGGKYDGMSLGMLKDIYNEHMNVLDLAAAKKVALQVIEETPLEARNSEPFLRSPKVTIGEVLCEQGKFAEGKPHLLKVSELDPKTTPELKRVQLQARSALALCYAEEGDREKAIETLTQVRGQLSALKLAPRYHWILERCQERLDRIEDQE